MARRNTRRTSTVFLTTIWLIMLLVSLVLIATFLTRFFSVRSGGQHLLSQDWSGYSVASDFVNPKPVVVGVSGSWAVPRVIVSLDDRFSAVWIGIGGEFDEGTLIQTGTEEDSLNLTESYSVWYELLPNDSVTISTMNVSSGDNISASINLVDSATNTWTIKINDVSTGQSYNENFVYDCSKLSAEWIVERPTVDQTIATLADIGSVTFTDATATFNNTTGRISDFPSAQIVMVDRLNNELTSVSSLNSDGSGFTVAYAGSVAATLRQLERLRVVEIAVSCEAGRNLWKSF